MNITLYGEGQRYAKRQLELLDERTDYQEEVLLKLRQAHVAACRNNCTVSEWHRNGECAKQGCYFDVVKAREDEKSRSNRQNEDGSEGSDIQ